MRRAFHIFRIVFICFVFLLQLSVSNAQDTIYLPNDTSLWTTGPKLVFIANSIAETNEDGKVISGFIKETQYIWTATRLIKFKASSQIQFDTKGNVILGILTDNIELRTAGGFVFFMKDKEIRLNEKGKVIEAYILRNILFKSKTKEIMFKAGSFIRFDSIGNVQYGTIAERQRFDCNNGENRAFSVGSTIEFDKEFKVIIEDKETN